MENYKAARTLNGARGYAELGMYQDAWDAVESLPPSLRLTPQAVAVRLLVLAGLEKWEESMEFAKMVTPGFPQEVREAAGRCHLAHAEALCAGGDLNGAKEALRALISIWPEGCDSVVMSRAWDCLRRVDDSNHGPLKA